MEGLDHEKTTTEKITININVVDLGFVDLLVSEGFYSNRTDFIKTSIRNQLQVHSDFTNRMVNNPLEKTEKFVGIIHIGRDFITNLKASNKLVSYDVIGMLIIANDIPLEEISQVIKTIRVFGVCKCSADVRKYYHL
ncbi:hypothetical protein [Gorillibacterium timonense]|uniref:hypothetical protein n=1 Tax=Gorillibacterium timonense TaxID=1689269 RepID=UPI0009EADD2C|nr:hypothetical protein [Gorillibacterium timonense]